MNYYFYRKKNTMTQLSYHLIKSKRKTISIEIRPDKTIIVKAPSYLSDEEIIKAVTKKENWIRKKLEESPSLQHVTYQYKTGELFWYRGEKVPLMIQESSAYCNPVICFTDEKLQIILGTKATAPLIKSLLEKEYHKQAFAVISDRVLYYHALIYGNPLPENSGLKCPSPYSGKPLGTIRIKSQKSCWGSCSSRGNLNFNWHLIMAPPEILDYVVVHELCHLNHMNHSNDFWQMVGQFIPDYKTKRKWLKENGKYLSLSHNYTI